MKAFCSNSQPHSLVLVTLDTRHVESPQASWPLDFTLFAYLSRRQNFGQFRTVRLHKLAQRSTVLASPESSWEVQNLGLWPPKIWIWVFSVARAPRDSMHVKVWEALLFTSPLNKFINFLYAVMNWRIFLQRCVDPGVGRIQCMFNLLVIFPSAPARPFRGADLRGHILILPC